MPTKNETAQFLADAHFGLDEGIARIFRVLAPGESDGDGLPVKLLEVNPGTPEVGISPVGMAADPSRGVHHGSVIIEISPAELDRLQNEELTLPHGWRVAVELRPRAPIARAVSLHW